ncbi:SDR family NAD(P)-dependent oxidoreductase [Streptomyces sp. NPDC057781]|uniref:SDR family NAD(P)-dependent oxidoreductase n=1 Tax=unclassified Streptomyces TaxID=2593676 RepID=UPI0036A208B6
MSGPARQVVVVTGASSGIGRGAALAFAARGVSVVLAARSEQALAEVARECEERGGRALAVPTDVSDEAAVQALAQCAADWSGRIDIWVNAAAVWSYGRFEDTPGPVFRQIVETTLLGQVYAARAVLPHFRAEGHGVLINISSLYGRLSSPYVAPYVTAKWGLLGFSEVLRQELRDTPGIAVCTILPGAVDTPIYRHAANYTGRQIRPPAACDVSRAGRRRGAPRGRPSPAPDRRRADAPHRCLGAPVHPRTLRPSHRACGGRLRPAERPRPAARRHRIRPRLPDPHRRRRMASARSPPRRQSTDAGRRRGGPHHCDQSCQPTAGTERDVQRRLRCDSHPRGTEEK